MSRPLKSTALLLAGMALFLALPSQAAPAQPVPRASRIEDDLIALLKRTRLAEACQGGSCQTGLGGVLSCPTSGGPTCASSQPCACVCTQMPNGSWSSLNYCLSS